MHGQNGIEEMGQPDAVGFGHQAEALPGLSQGAQQVSWFNLVMVTDNSAGQHIRRMMRSKPP